MRQKEPGGAPKRAMVSKMKKFKKFGPAQTAGPSRMKNRKRGMSAGPSRMKRSKGV